MGWDVFIFKAPVQAVDVADLADDDLAPLGAAAQIRDRLLDRVPQLNLAGAWGDVEGPTWTIELNIGAADPVDSIMLHVRGSGDDVFRVIHDIAEAVGGRALDVSTSRFLVGDQDEAVGWHGFQEFRDRTRGQP